MVVLSGQQGVEGVSAGSHAAASAAAASSTAAAAGGGLTAIAGRLTGSVAAESAAASSVEADAAAEGAGGEAAAGGVWDSGGCGGASSSGHSIWCSAVRASASASNRETCTCACCVGCGARVWRVLSTYDAWTPAAGLCAAAEASLGLPPPPPNLSTGPATHPGDRVTRALLRQQHPVVAQLHLQAVNHLDHVDALALAFWVALFALAGAHRCRCCCCCCCCWLLAAVVSSGGRFPPLLRFGVHLFAGVRVWRDRVVRNRTS